MASAIIFTTKIHPSIEIVDGLHWTDISLKLDPKGPEELEVFLIQSCNVHCSGLKSDLVLQSPNHDIFQVLVPLLNRHLVGFDLRHIGEGIAIID